MTALPPDQVLADGQVMWSGSNLLRGDGATPVSRLTPLKRWEVLRLLWPALQRSEDASGAAAAAQAAADLAKSIATNGVAAAGAALAAANTALGKGRLPSAARGSQLSLVNSNVETTVVSLSTPSVSAGSAFRARLFGTIQAGLGQPALTFRIYVGANPAPQTVVVPAALFGIAWAAPFEMELVAEVRADKPYVGAGRATLNVTPVMSLWSISAATAAVAAPADGPVAVKVTAQWASAAGTSHKLLVEHATLAQVSA